MKTITSILLVVLYILNCFRLRTAPWKYFQLNAKYFSEDKGIFSKLRIDELIPDYWRLKQRRLTDTVSAETGSDSVAAMPAIDLLNQGDIQVRLQAAPECNDMHFPIFVKPEWGQNAQGIVRADSCEELVVIREKLNGSAVRYLIQEAASESLEFEIYTLFPDAERNQCAVISVTQSINQTQRYPINSVYNRDTHYHNITSAFTDEQLQALAEYVQRIGRFAQSRLCVRADSIAQLCAGEFHVIELNLFTPMPIHVLDRNTSWPQKIMQIQQCASTLAKATANMAPTSSHSAIFTRMTMYGRGNRSLGTAFGTFRSLL